MLVDDPLVDDQNLILLSFFIKTQRSNCLGAEMESTEDFDPLINSVIGRNFGVGNKTQIMYPTIVQVCVEVMTVAQIREDKEGKETSGEKHK